MSNPNKVYFKLYYDDHCPLCLNAIKSIKRIVAPKSTTYSPLSEANLDQLTSQRALMEMLLVDNKGNKYWGVDTYIKILKISSRRYRWLLRAIAIFIRFPGVYNISRVIYSIIAKKRARCNTLTCGSK